MAYRRLTKALLLVLFITVFGTVGYYLIGGGRWPIYDCLYMTLITISTVGFREVFEVSINLPAKLFTMVLIISGMGSLLYFLTATTAFLIEGELQQLLRRKRMTKLIDRMQDHLIVCGAGATGYHSVAEMVQVGEEVVVIDRDPLRLDKLEPMRVAMIEGDATDDEILEQAGVARARGLIAAVSDDMANLFVTISARQRNPNLRIIARAVHPKSIDKLRRAGATRVVSPNQIGGMRMASEMIRPTVVTFLDQMVRSKGETLRLEEVELPPTSPMVGRPLRDSGIRKLGDLLVVAVRNPETGEFHYNPSPDHVLCEGEVLVVLGRVDEARKLRDR